MIYFIVHGDGRSAINLLLTDWGKALFPRLRVLDYRFLFRQRRLPVGSYLFSGLEGLGSEEREKVATCWRALSRSGFALRLLNHPLTAMRRYELLRTLHERGVNDFDVYRLTEARKPVRFPVFLRREDDHTGPQSPLLTTQAALDRALESHVASGACRDGWIVMEFSETRAADGLYRKYGAFNVGGRIIPRHLHVSRDWIVKSASREVGSSVVEVEEELEYVETNPHEARLKEIFALARIDYGRIDYAVHGGRMTIFEINTNPQILKPGPSKHAARKRVKERFAERFVPALAELDHAAPRRSSVPVRFDPRPLHKRRPPFIDLMVAVAQSLGLRRFEPWIYRWLVAIRGLWK